MARKRVWAQGKKEGRARDRINTLNGVWWATRIPSDKRSRFEESWITVEFVWNNGSLHLGINFIRSFSVSHTRVQVLVDGREMGRLNEQGWIILSGVTPDQNIQYQLARAEATV